MSASDKIRNELKAVGVTTLYFAIWLGALTLLKKLILAEYDIEFKGLSVTLVGALILAKVVLILEYVPLGDWVCKQPAWVDVVLRTLVYTFGVFIVMILERSFEARHEHGGLLGAVSALFNGVKLFHVLVETVVVSGALFSFNVLSVIRGHLGPGGLKRLFLSPATERVEGTAGSGS